MKLTLILLLLISIKLNNQLFPNVHANFIEIENINNFESSLEKKENRYLSNQSLKEINNLIHIIENSNKRKELLDFLKSFTSLNKGKEDKPYDLLLDVTNSITNQIERIARVSFNIFIAIIKFPNDFFKSLSLLERDKIYKLSIDLFIKFGSCLFLGFLVEKMVLYTSKSILKRTQRVFLFTQNLSRIVSHFILTIIPLFFFLLASIVSLSYITINPLKESLLSLTITIFLIRFLYFIIFVILSPKDSKNRLVNLSSRSATYLYRRILILGHIFIFGIFLTKIFQYFLLSQEAMTTWLGLYGFCFMLTFISFLNNYKDSINHWLKLEEKGLENSSRIIVGSLSILSKIWYFIIIILVFSMYISWVLKEFDYLVYLLVNSFLTMIIFTSSILISKYFYKYSQIWFSDLGQKSLTKENAKGLLENLLQSTHSLIPLIQVILYVICLISILKTWGIDLFHIINDKSVHNIFMIFFSILTILWITKFLWMMLDLIVNYQTNPLILKDKVLEPSILIKTLAPIIKTIGRLVLIVFSIVFILNQLNINILPLVYGFSIIGLAFSFGAQDLAKDLINGVLILLEGNLAVGEYVSIGESSGIVESITPRSLFIRHSNGSLQSIPFSKVNTIINRCRDFTIIKIPVTVEVNTPINIIYSTLAETLNLLKSQVEFKDRIHSNIQIHGLQDFSSQGYTVLVSFRTNPDPTEEMVYIYYQKLKEIADQHKIKLLGKR